MHLLLLNAFAMGGTVRTVLSLAGELAAARPVEVLTLVRGRPEPFLPPPEGVPIRVLADRTAEGPSGLLGKPLDRLPSVLVHPDDGAHRWCSLWTDIQLYRALRRCRGVLVTTRPAFGAFASRYAPQALTVVAQEHGNLASHPAALRAEVRRTYPHVATVATLTAGDADEYRTLLGPAAPRIVDVPNAVPPMPASAARTREKLILAAGRLHYVKGFDLLIRAFAEISHRAPEWRLRIYGEGEERAPLLGLIEELELSERIDLLPATDRLPDALASASIFALSSRWEGLPMVLLEAMSKGAAVVAFDCPTGPAEVLTHEVDGVLVAPERVDELGAALLRVIGDADLRASLGAAARRTAGDVYDLRVIGARWSRLLDESRA